MQARRARVALVWSVALTVAVIAATGPATAGPGTGPPSLPPVESATDIGVVAQNPLVLGRDGIISGLFQGQSYWAFGDTILSVPGHDRDSWSNNTLSWTSDLNGSDGITLSNDHLDRTGAPTEFIPHTKGERAYNYRHDADHCTAEPCGAEFAIWPAQVIPDEARGRVLFPYSLLHRVIGEEGWTTIGAGIAVWTPGSPVVRPVLSPNSRHPTLMWGPREVSYTNATLVEGETAYMYGCKLVWIEHQCRVARVHLADILEKSKWEYYLGDEEWGSNRHAAVPVFVGGAAGSTVLYSSYHGMYMAIYSAIFSDDVVYRVSNTPWGPWSDQALLFTGRPGWEGNTAYAGEAHPEYAEDGGRVQYVTYWHVTGFLRGDAPLVRVVFGPDGP